MSATLTFCYKKPSKQRTRHRQQAYPWLWRPVALTLLCSLLNEARRHDDTSHLFLPDHSPPWLESGRERSHGADVLLRSARRTMDIVCVDVRAGNVVTELRKWNSGCRVWKHVHVSVELLAANGLWNCAVRLHILADLLELFRVHGGEDKVPTFVDFILVKKVSSSGFWDKYLLGAARCQ